MTNGGGSGPGGARKEPGGDPAAAIAQRIALAIYLSLAANVLLMAVKSAAFVAR